MTGHQLVKISPCRLVKSTRSTHPINSQQRPGNLRLPRQRFMTNRVHQMSYLSSHPQKRQLINYFFSSTSHPNADIGNRDSNTYLLPRCPTCTAEIKTNFNLTTQIEEKCKCPNCKAFLPTQMVVKCGDDQSYSRMDQKDDNEKSRLKSKNLIDYFKLFEIDKKFLGLNFLKLKKSYHLWQQIVHPDFSQHNNSRNDNSSNLSLNFMKDWSALINRANDILSGDLTRAEYLVSLSHSSNCTPSGSKIQLHGNIKLASETDSLEDTSLLMEIMEAREQLEAAKTRQEVESIQSSNQESIQEVLNLMNQKFDKLIFHNQGLENDEIDQLKELIIKLRYLENIKKIISSTHL